VRGGEKREQSVRGEIHNKSTLGNRGDDVPLGKKEDEQGLFFSLILIVKNDLRAA
jgi:hypothetical protein